MSGATDGPPKEPWSNDPLKALTAVSAAEEQRIQLDDPSAGLDDLRLRVAANRSVATAMGILMARRQLGASDAFALIVAVCRQTGRRMSDIAGELLATGTVVGAGALVGSRGGR